MDLSKGMVGVLTLRQFAEYCGPAVLARVVGVDTVTAARFIRAVSGESAGYRGGTTYRGLVRALKGNGYPKATYVHVHRRAYGRGQLTLGQFLRSYGGLAILAVRSGPQDLHYVAVEGGEVIEDNGQPLGPRRRVWAIIYPNGKESK